mmetsp:Transcript_15623/g.15020  ORF Transcript_15623/g.15020 Transcript_15623/m.15020 type:complete len:196 (+) Transcript_15623:57-644(+)
MLYYIHDGASAAAEDEHQVCDLGTLCRNWDDGVFPDSIYRSFMGLAGLCWTVAYILYVIQSHRYGDYRGVPAPALVLNVTWEFVFSFVWIDGMSPSQLFINRVWITIDLCMLLQFVRFQLYDEWKNTRIARIWYPLLFGTLITFLIAFVKEIKDYQASTLPIFRVFLCPSCSVVRYWRGLKLASPCRIRQTITLL